LRVSVPYTLDSREVFFFLSFKLSGRIGQEVGFPFSPREMKRYRRVVVILRYCNDEQTREYTHTHTR
jgi:hypothetical protein